MMIPHPGMPFGGQRRPLHPSTSAALQAAAQHAAIRARPPGIPRPMPGQMGPPGGYAPPPMPHPPVPHPYGGAVPATPYPGPIGHEMPGGIGTYPGRTDTGPMMPVGGGFEGQLPHPDMPMPTPENRDALVQHFREQLMAEQQTTKTRPARRVTRAAGSRGSTRGQKFRGEAVRRKG